jgi:hypothetical protein
VARFIDQRLHAAHQQERHGDDPREHDKERDAARDAARNRAEDGHRWDCLMGPKYNRSHMRTARLEAFSDGVIAILITIMVLELRTPEGHDWEALGSLKTKL